MMASNDTRATEENVQLLENNNDVLANYEPIFRNIFATYGNFIEKSDQLTLILYQLNAGLGGDITHIRELMVEAGPQGKLGIDHYLTQADSQYLNTKHDLEDKCGKFVDGLGCIEDFSDSVVYVKQLPNILDATQFGSECDADLVFIDSDLKIDYSDITKRPEGVYKQFKTLLQLHQTAHEMINELDISSKEELLSRIRNSYVYQRGSIEKKYNETATDYNSLTEAHPHEDFKDELGSFTKAAMDALPDKYSEVRRNYEDDVIVSGNPEKMLVDLIERFQSDRVKTMELMNELLNFRDVFKGYKNINRLVGKTIAQNTSIALLNHEEKNHGTDYYLGVIDGVYSNIIDEKIIFIDTLYDTIGIYTDIVAREDIDGDDRANAEMNTIIKEIGERYGELLESPGGFDKAVNYAEKHGKDDVLLLLKKNKKLLLDKGTEQKVKDDAAPTLHPIGN